MTDKSLKAKPEAEPKVPVEERSVVQLEPVVHEMLVKLNEELIQVQNQIQGRMQMIVQTAVSTLKLDGAYGLSPDLKHLVPSRQSAPQNESNPGSGTE